MKRYRYQRGNDYFTAIKYLCDLAEKIAANQSIVIFEPECHIVEQTYTQIKEKITKLLNSPNIRERKPKCYEVETTDYDRKLAIATYIVAKLKESGYSIKDEFKGVMDTDPMSCEEPHEPVTSKLFKKMNDFIKEKVENVVRTYYQGSAANLALIETTLFDHDLLRKRNAHTAFIRVLCAWGTIDRLSDVDIKKVMLGMSNKMHHLPVEGYMEWKGSDFVNDKKTCQDIGKDLGDTIKYSRNIETKPIKPSKLKI